MATNGDHSFVEDFRNRDIIIGIRDGVSLEFNLVKRADAKISVFDSSVLVGDGVWEGLRIIKGNVQYAREHFERLFQTAYALWIDLGVTKRELLELIYKTIDANPGMVESDDVHLRLICTRGLKSTPYQSRKVNVGKSLIIIIPEYKKVDSSTYENGIKLVTSWVRRGSPDTKDEMWNHLSKATDIMASLSAEAAGADGALMLDHNGFVKTCNATNFFIVRKGELWAPTMDNQMHGITRQKVLEISRRHGIVVKEQNFTNTDVYTADEAFRTGTFASQVPVKQIDGLKIGKGRMGPITFQISHWYKEDVLRDVSRSRDETLSSLES
ncbi:branched-chain amino acid aminotransferase [Pichia kudriavzevii]|uniref:Branched-chain amino acid aminotransferase n=1 Tax=Pichia kudriavzevii TaxID=4909 RepID=A0A1Z8JLT7_PICKU|nr:branched-chain amino acid aminotransferase [Pichia kudriavzevii]